MPALAGGWPMAAAQSVLQPALTDPRNPQKFDPLKVPPFGKPPAAADNTRTPTIPPAAGNTGFDATGALRKKKYPKLKPGDAFPPPSAKRSPPPVLNGAPQKATAPQFSARAPYADVYRPSDALPRPPRPFKPVSDPFEPLGIRVGGFVLKPSIEVTRGFDTNPNRATNGPSSPYTVIAPELVVKSEWTRHEVGATLRGSTSSYDKVSSANRPQFDSKATARIDVSRDQRIDVEGRFLLGTEYPGSPNLTAGIAKLPIFTTIGGTLGYAQRFNRLELSVKGNFDRTTYRDSELTDGSTFSNRDRDYNQYGIQLRAGYELTPGVKPFVELGLDRRVHDLAVDRNGERRDSNAVTPKLGTTFEFSRILTGEISVGYLTRTYEDPDLAPLKGLVADASLIWVPTGLTTVTLTAKSSADESILPDVSGALRRDFGLQIDHALRRWLIATLKFGTGFDDYIGLGRSDKRSSLGAALTYKFSREFWLKAEARHERLRSNELGSDYDASIFLVGVKLQR